MLCRVSLCKGSVLDTKLCVCFALDEIGTGLDLLCYLLKILTRWAFCLLWKKYSFGCWFNICCNLGSVDCFESTVQSAQIQRPKLRRMAHGPRPSALWAYLLQLPKLLVFRVSSGWRLLLILIYSHLLSVDFPSFCHYSHFNFFFFFAFAYWER